MMKSFDKKDDVPEALREGAIETREGKWVVDDGSEETLKEAGKKTLKAEREKREKAEEDARKATEALAEMQRTKTAQEGGVSEAALKKIKDDFEAANKPIVEEVTRLRNENRDLVLVDGVQRLALKYGVMADRIKAAMTLLKSRTDLSAEKTIIVLDEKGQVTTESIDDFLSKTFKKEAPWLYAGTGGSGSGTGHGGGTGEGERTKPVPPTDQQRADVAGAF